MEYFSIMKQFDSMMACLDFVRHLQQVILPFLPPFICFDVLRGQYSGNKIEPWSLLFPATKILWILISRFKPFWARFSGRGDAIPRRGLKRFWGKLEGKFGVSVKSLLPRGCRETPLSRRTCKGGNEISKGTSLKSQSQFKKKVPSTSGTSLIILLITY